jgi:hypothetical protein
MLSQAHTFGTMKIIQTQGTQKNKKKVIIGKKEKSFHNFVPQKKKLDSEAVRFRNLEIFFFGFL